MKVLFLTDNISSQNGWGRYSKSILDNMSNLGVDYSVASKEGNILLPLSFGNFLRNIFSIRKIAKKHDIVHALDGWPFGVYGLFAVLGTNKKLFINGIGTYSVAPLYFKFRGFLLKVAYRHAKCIFTISNYVRERILEHVKLDNIYTVHMGLVLLPEPSKGEVDQFKQRHLLINRYPVLLTVGEIKERKGQFDTLQAVKFIKKEYPDIMYVMTGSDKSSAYVDKINSYARENDLTSNCLIVSDVVDDATLACCYESCDIFLLNSNNEGNHFEGFGLVVLEANQFGKPAIGSRGCGIEDAIKDGVNGYLTNQRDHEDMGDKIKKVIEEKEMDRNDIISYAKKFTWEKTAREYIKEYKK